MAVSFLTAQSSKEKGIKNLTELHNKRSARLEQHLSRSSSGPFLTGEDCSYADIFLYTCVRTTQKTGGFGILREVCGDDPFQAYPRILKICDEVEKIEKVKETVGSKFSDCPI